MLLLVLSAACRALSVLDKATALPLQNRRRDESFVPYWWTKMCSLVSYWWAVAMAALTGCDRMCDPEDDKDNVELEEDKGLAAWHLCTR